MINNRLPNTTTRKIKFNDPHSEKVEAFVNASSTNVDEIKRVKYYPILFCYTQNKFREAGLDDRDVMEIIKYI